MPPWHLIRLSLFLSIFCLHAWREPGNEARAVLLVMNVDI